MIMVTTSSRRHWQSNTDTVPAPFPTGARTVLGLRQRHRPLPRDSTGHGLAPLPARALGFGQCQGLLFPPGCRFWEPSGPPSPSTLGLGSTCPWCRGHAGFVVLSPMGAPKTMAFSFFFFFAFFGSKFTPPGALEKARLCTGGAALPAPLHRGQSRGAALGKGLWAGARPRSPSPVKSPRWSQQFGVLDPVPPS